jgi:hypothetical protein
MGVLYCRCAYAQVLPTEVKQAVLEGLCSSPGPFTAVPDLCEMSARRDPRLAELARQPGLKICACHPRAVEWLFHAAQAPLPADVEYVNLRELNAAEALEKLLPHTPNPPSD